MNKEDKRINWGSIRTKKMAFPKEKRRYAYGSLDIFEHILDGNEPNKHE